MASVKRTLSDRGSRKERQNLPAHLSSSPLPPLHAALQILVELAELQDAEVGDGTTSVVIVAAELLRRANDLVRAKIHPTSIISGYRLAMREVGGWVVGGSSHSVCARARPVFSTCGSCAPRSSKRAAVRPRLPAFPSIPICPFPTIFTLKN